ncbi:MAG: spermidine/putrescine ABC transporter substrate-binding protein, partial [Actinomycetota bacterium]|nr:spermidine/putrescine ABC transporter substrate-binding protein [Actinomycetota bacterium]
MAHPKERPTSSRREFLRRAAAAGIALPSMAAVLAACRDSSTDIGGPSATTGAGGIALASPENPVTLPLYDDAPAIEDGLSQEAGPLRVYNWNDYIYKKVIKQFEAEFGVEVEYTQFGGMAEALNKVQNDTIQWDLFFPTIENVGKLVAAKRVQPWNHSYMSNLPNIWGNFQDPWYDGGAQYTMPYLTWKTGIGYRSDFVEDPATYDMPFDIFWDTKYAGKVGVLDEYRETIGMALLRNGGTDFNSTDPAELTTAVDSLLELLDLVNVEIGPGDYQKLAEGTSHVRYSWSGNMNYAQYYLPKGTEPDVLGYYYPPEGGWEVANDTIVINKEAESPVLAHLFINFLMDKEVALTNFGYEGFQPPLVGVDRATFLEAGFIPPNLENTLVAEEDFAQGQPVLPLSPEDDQLYQ